MSDNITNTDEIRMLARAAGRDHVTHTAAIKTLARAVEARSALVAPIRHEGSPVGTLTFYSVTAPRRFDGVAVAEGGPTSIVVDGKTGRLC